MNIIPAQKQILLPVSPVKNKKKVNRLPLLISVPHGGYTIPPELRSIVSLDFPDIFPDSDPCTRKIYDLREEVYSYHDTDIARAIVDLNRSKDDLPPVNPDGVIKSHTIMGVKIYRSGFQPDRQKIQALLEKYYHPYHQKIQDELRDQTILCGLDCHTMLKYPPGEETGTSEQRPFICLSNNGDENGNGREEELTCSAEMLKLLANCLSVEFPEEADNIVLNIPFKGGHVSRSHSRELPWIQVELNRRAYLQKPWFNRLTFEVTGSRLEHLRNKFLLAFTAFCAEAGNLQYPQSHRDLRQQEYMDELSMSSSQQFQ